MISVRCQHCHKENGAQTLDELQEKICWYCGGLVMPPEEE